MRIRHLAPLALALAALPAQAQNYQARPAQGAHTVRAGAVFATDFSLAPLSVPEGEDWPTNEGGCSGVFNLAQPSLNVQVDGAPRPQRLYVRSGTDTVLMARTPSGEWLCNDDTDGVNPALMLDPAQPGVYNVWVGLFFGNDVETPVTFYAADNVATTVDHAMRPSGGQATLDGGFTPDPREVAVTIGSDVQLIDEGCSGFFATAPSYNVNYRGDGTLPLYIYARTSGEDDLTIAVNGPDGLWTCNDDADGLNPGVKFDRPIAGLYGVWVGSFRSVSRTEAAGSATLFVSEVTGPDPAAMMDMDEHYDEGYYEGDSTDYAYPEGYTGGEDLMRDASPSGGTLQYGTGSEVTLDVQAGGTSPNSVIGMGCTGFIDPSAPTAVLDYSGSGAPLSFWATADEDATMIISMPDGSLTCNDDFDGLMPGIAVENAQPGRYAVWVGLYGSDSATIPATLHVGTGMPFGQ